MCLCGPGRGGGGGGDCTVLISEDVSNMKTKIMVFEFMTLASPSYKSYMSYQIIIVSQDGKRLMGGGGGGGG